MSSEARPHRPSASAREVVLDEQHLAAQARTTLAAADTAVVRLGPGRAGSATGYRVRVRDDDGEPRLSCRRDGAVHRAARERRVAGLLLAPHAAAAAAVRLAGRLVADSAAAAAGEPAASAQVSLRVEHVVIGCPHPGAGRRELRGVLREGAREREIALERYALAQPDQLAAQLPRVLRHVNDHHGEQVHRLAAATAGRPPDAVLAASLAELSPAGVEINWIDEAGGHDHPIRFGTAAHTVDELVCALRAHLPRCCP